MSTILRPERLLTIEKSLETLLDFYRETSSTANRERILNMVEALVETIIGRNLK